MDKSEVGVSRAFYTVKQLAALFGKSEDTIRRWKNEGIGRGEDNIRLRSLEREDEDGRKNSRHLVFPREAVIEFVRENPFLMDDAPELGKLMQAEDAWRDRAIPMPGTFDFDEVSKGLALVRPMAEEEDEWSRPPRIERRPVTRVSKVRGAQGESRAESDLQERIRRLREAARFDEVEDNFYDSHEREFGSEPRKNPMPRGDREAGEREYQRRMRIINFALDTLRERCDGFDKERAELEKAMEELQGSSLSTAASVTQVLGSKCSELEAQKAMLLEFIAIIEEEIRED